MMRNCFPIAAALVACAVGGFAQEPPDKITVKEYRPKSIYKIPVTEVKKAKFPVIDVHSHVYAKTPEQIAQWVRNMDEVGIEKTVILSGLTGAAFDEVYKNYSKYPGRFEIWCGLDASGLGTPEFAARAVKELERCRRAGARGVGEILDKGSGLSFSAGGKRVNGPHPDDPALAPVFEKCAELKMPVNIHVADPIWMYEPMDKHNDGLWNAFQWRLDNKPGIVGHSGMIDILERTVRAHPKTTFIACHFANLDYDLGRLGQMLDRNPNLYADISARYAETAPTPRFALAFYQKYSGRLLYGTDMGMNPAMYRITFRVLETLDEHFYEIEQFGYHWSLNGFGLPAPVLKEVYRDNAARLLSAR